MVSKVLKQDEERFSRPLLSVCHVEAFSESADLTKFSLDVPTFYGSVDSGQLQIEYYMDFNDINITVIMLDHFKFTCTIQSQLQLILCWCDEQPLKFCFCGLFSFEKGGGGRMYSLPSTRRHSY